MRFPINVVFRCLAEAYMAGIKGESRPPYNEPEEPYYLIVGAAIDGAYKQGRRQEPFDAIRCAEWLDDLPSDITDNVLLGQLYNWYGTLFNVYWVGDENTVRLEPCTTTQSSQTAPSTDTNQTP